MGKAVLAIIVVVLAVYSLFDVIATPKTQVRTLPRLVWVIVVLVPLLGPALWLTVGKSRNRPTGPPRTSRRPLRGPDDDPDFLRSL